MTPAEALARARSACGKQIAYKLGKGGFNPSNPLPCNKDNECDCSGFVSWVLGVSRWVRDPHPWLGSFPSEWISTTSIHSDALKTLKQFRAVADPEPGDVLVYPDKPKSYEGHVGIVSQVHEGLATMVIHCSHGNMNNTGDAIAETSVLPFWWTRGAKYARPVVYGEEALGGADNPEAA